MELKERFELVKGQTKDVTLVAVSKTHSAARISQVYELGQRHFGENKVQELVEKAEELPSDIKWHLIGHLQRNKVKYIASFVHLIHSIDSLKLLQEVNKRAAQHQRTINCLLQVHIADESSKFGLSVEELYTLIDSQAFQEMQNVKVVGLMGMATNTSDENQIRTEFNSLSSLFNQVKEKKTSTDSLELVHLSMGMSGDYGIAIEEGSTMVRVGSKIFGDRNYS